MSDEAFWETTPLEEMSEEQWESLCDGCGRCCLHKLEDVDTAEIYYTQIACRLLDTSTCRCTDYEHRRERVAGCVVLTPANLARKLAWLPRSCAYRRLAEGRGLAWWHPLVSGDRATVRLSSVSMAHRCVSELDVPDDEEPAFHIIDWIET